MRPRLGFGLLLLATVLIVGTVGYHLIEGAPWWDAFYMTVITVTTVGFREVFPLSREGQAFTIVLLVLGLGLIFVVATELGRNMVQGELRRLLGRWRRLSMLDRMRGHEVICGYGRMGRAVVEALRKESRQLVVIEKNPEKVELLDTLGVPVIRGDATQEEVLRQAGVERARGLVACLADDAHNVYTVLTARSLNPDLYIVARASEEGAELRLTRAGANRVVNPYRLGGLRLAHVLTKPAVVDFLELSLSRGGPELELEELTLDARNPLVGKSLSELDLRRRFQVGVVAVQRGQHFLPNPEPGFRFAHGDVLVVVGSKEGLAAFEKAMLAEHLSQEERP
ncbi:MAG: potassium channel protein [Thermoanaerobaculum sp.]|nr:potassium channel protein [Thermoanaerobaculum sp.]MDW7968410.1 potassium channel protein [Thermoanaerobaculum sp.]